ncbi:hypothetical protein [Treponema pedis]|uniref:Uncharacterized protein n=1 Tax=Treponema pedis str. T A4 TaxID=1291379 RepID=S5ZNX0_9SPIR|nr:hypothetical protein [Treponema pedis]AGT44317.1 hypothetical protein TPE_1843 [Treponema pedis str. T A4]QSI05017.1 hypothetical protein DYQ05_08855 [Treponema pedis]
MEIREDFVKKIMRKTSLIIKVVFIGFMMLFSISCNQGINVDLADDESMSLVTPYSDMDDLSMSRSIVFENSDVVDWKVARFFALIQKIDFESEYPWHGAVISKYPVIIYHPDSNRVRYYEFRVIKNGIELGSITCNALKSAGTPVAYVSTMTHKVPIEMARRLANFAGDMKLTSVNYPNQFIVRETEVNSRSIELGETQFKDALTGKAVERSAVFIERSIVECLHEADEETLKQLEITPEAKIQMLTEAEEHTSAMSDLWKHIDEITPKILTTTDEEVEREYKNPYAITVEAERHIYNTETTAVQKTILDDWYNKRDWGNPYCYCGPAAVAFVVIGLGEKSGYKNTPLSIFEREKINNIYKFFENTIGTGPKVISSLSNGLGKHTNYKIEQKLCHKWNDVNSHLSNYNLPVISLRSGWYGDWGFHYRVIIGTETDRLREYHKISWWWFGWKSKYWTKDKYSHWYYMHDNGSDGGNFWERSGQVFQSTLGLVKHK